MPPLSRSFPVTDPRSGGVRRRAVASSVAVILLSLTLVSCVFHRSPGRNAVASTAPAFAPAESRIGVVRAIGAEQRFVLIETPSASATTALSEGQLLHCRPPDALTRAATADLRVSREHHQALVVANVVTGEPVVGAVVYSSPNASPAATPPAESVSSVATTPLPLAGPRQP